jgi:hypothetical protein
MCTLNEGSPPSGIGYLIGWHTIRYLCFDFIITIPIERKEIKLSNQIP